MLLRRGKLSKLLLRLHGKVVQEAAILLSWMRIVRHVLELIPQHLSFLFTKEVSDLVIFRLEIGVLLVVQVQSEIVNQLLLLLVFRHLEEVRHWVSLFESVVESEELVLLSFDARLSYHILAVHRLDVLLLGDAVVSAAWFVNALTLVDHSGVGNTLV